MSPDGPGNSPDGPGTAHNGGKDRIFGRPAIFGRDRLESTVATGRILPLLVQVNRHRPDNNGHCVLTGREPDWSAFFQVTSMPDIRDIRRRRIMLLLVAMIFVTCVAKTWLP